MLPGKLMRVPNSKDYLRVPTHCRFNPIPFYIAQIMFIFTIFTVHMQYIIHCNAPMQTNRRLLFVLFLRILVYNNNFLYFIYIFVFIRSYYVLVGSHAYLFVLIGEHYNSMYIKTAWKTYSNSSIENGHASLAQIFFRCS